MTRVFLVVVVCIFCIGIFSVSVTAWRRRKMLGARVNVFEEVNGVDLIVR